MERGAYEGHRRRLLTGDGSGATGDTMSRVTADTLCLRVHRAPLGEDANPLLSIRKVWLVVCSVISRRTSREEPYAFFYR
jgi:hypothetical protein